MAIAINDIRPLPDPKEESEGRHTGFEEYKFAHAYNLERSKTRGKFPVHHALENAASEFRLVWERHSKSKYTRGGYEPKPVQALHKIIARIDSRIPESLVGTAIENIRTTTSD